MTKSESDFEGEIFSKYNNISNLVWVEIFHATYRDWEFSPLMVASTSHILWSAIAHYFQKALVIITHIVLHENTTEHDNIAEQRWPINLQAAM